MSVTNYNNTCKYHIGKLDNVIFLISEEASKDIIIDNGAAYISGITEEPLVINCYNIKVEETDELDERYKFTHSVSFSVNGYLNHLDLDNRFYAIVRDSEGTYWMINPMFPSKVTYTYTLNSTNSFTNFVMATASNHPILKVVDFEATHTRDCGYFHCTLKDLRLNESKYSRASNGLIRYANDGFKDISFNRNSAIFTETFNGDDISHEIDFSIPFDDYKSSWHYNLLEFQDNLYSAIIGTTCGKYIITGFHHGLQPSFSVSADDDMKMNTIDISMSDLHDNGKFIEYVDDVTLISESGKTYINTTEFDAWDCVSKNTAKYILRQEVDAFQNPTGLYKCLEGYESRFAFLGDALVGTFSDVVTFNNPSCGGDSCELDTSIPSTIVFTSSSVKRYSLMSDTNWSITNNDPNITISPTSGNAHQAYTITIANSYTANTATTFTINYCNTSRTVNVNVDTTSSCFPASNHFTITAEGQYVTIPIQCCAKAVNASVVTRIQITSSSIKVYVPQNSTGSNRDIPLNVVWCDDSTSTVVITQSSVYERWVTEGQVCVGNQKCDFQRRYTGTTPSDINTMTNETRTTNCVASSECGSSSQRWIDVEGYTYCNNDKLYQVQKEQVSSDGGQTWTDTGNKRLGLELLDSGHTCSGISYEYRWLMTSATTCVGYNKYNLYIKERKASGTSVWEEVIPTTKSYNGQGDVTPHLIESGSTDCGYEPPVTPQYEWRLVSGYICDECDNTQFRWYTVSYNCQGYDKCAHQKKQYSSDGVTWIDVSPAETQDVVVEYNSFECGFVYPQYRWVRSGYTCVGYDVYENNVRQVSNDGGLTWQNVIPEQYSASTLVEHNSESCGYVPPAPKWVATYSDSHTESADCDSSSAISQNEITSSGITSVNIGNCVTSIGNSAFTDCYSLTSITIPNSVRTIGGDAFYQCSGLTSVTIPNSVTSIGSYAFGRCNSLTSITIPSGVTSIGEATFSYCTSLTSITIPSGVTSIGQWAFGNCSSLTSVTIPNSVTSIGKGAFQYCESLTSVTIPSGVTSIGDNAFYGCIDLTSITCLATTPPSLDTYAFDNTNNCPIYVPCDSLNAYKGASDWRDYTSRIQPIPPCSETKWIATYTGGTTSLAPCDSTSAITSGEISETNLESVDIGNCVTTIGNYAFEGCSGLTSITIPSGVTTIGYGAFEDCSGLTSVTIPDSVTTISSYTFANCSGLSSITIPSGVTRIGDTAFGSCTSLSSITIPSGVTKIDGYAFYNCSGLTSITCLAPTPPTLDVSYASTIFAYTNDCPIYVPCESVLTYRTSWSAFRTRIQGIQPCVVPRKWLATYTGGTTSSAECSSTSIVQNEVSLNDLESIEIGDCVTSIGTSAFTNCTSLTSVTIGSGVTTIGNYAFEGCSGLTSITIPDSVTLIGEEAFARCSGLTNVTIGSGVTNIAFYAFYGCYGLQSLTIYATTPPRLNYTFYATNNFNIYVPAESVNAYKSASGWSQFASRITAIT